MTDENRLDNIRDAVAAAENEMEIAEYLLQRPFHGGVVGHAYYAAFHFARALLLMDGLQGKTHGGVIHLLSHNFVRSGRLAADHVRRLAQLQKDRELATYEPPFLYGEPQALEAMESARGFAAAARALLVQGGCL